MKKSFIIFIGASLMALQGCIISISEDGIETGSTYHNESKRELKNREYIADASVGLSETTVKRALGTPDFNEIIVDGDKQYTVLYYRTHRTHGDGMTTKDECTPVVFLNGELHGIGESAIDFLNVG